MSFDMRIRKAAFHLLLPIVPFVAFSSCKSGVETDSLRISLKQYVERFNEGDSEWYTNAIPNVQALEVPQFFGVKSVAPSFVPNSF